MRFLSVEGVTGHEANIAAAVSDALKKVGVPASAIRFDDANKRIPLPTETGNLIVDLPGTRQRAAAAVLHPSRHRAALRRRQAATRRRSHRLRRHDGTWRRRPHRRCASGRACRDAHQAQAAASADHAAFHGTRGERASRSARTEPRRSRRPGHVHQCRRAARLGSDHRRGRAGKLGSRDQGPRVPCRRRAREGHIGDAGRSHRLGGGAAAPAGSARSSSPTAAAPAMSAFSAARMAKPAGDATNVVTDYAFIKGEARSPEAAFATKIAKGYERCLREGARRQVKDHEGADGRSDVQPRDVLPSVQARQRTARS